MHWRLKEQISSSTALVTPLLIAKLQADTKQHFGVEVGYHAADMSKPTEIEAMMHFAADKFGAVDVLVNNARIQYVASIDDFPTEKGVQSSRSISARPFTPNVWRCQP